MKKYVLKITYKEAGIVEYLSDFICRHEQWQTSTAIQRAIMYDEHDRAVDDALSLYKIKSFSKYHAEISIVEVEPFIIWREVNVEDICDEKA